MGLTIRKHGSVLSANYPDVPVTPEHIQSIRRLLFLHGLSLRKYPKENRYYIAHRGTRRMAKTKDTGRATSLRCHKPIEFYIEWLKSKF